MCALVYQTAWLRELRLVFGASTPATAAVLAVFMGGLGYGSLVLGRRAERAARPLAYYALLEVGIALTAAISPFLVDGARAVYVALGGTVTLGAVFGTLVRLVLAAAVLLPPTLLMGGTLPAAARAATAEGDVGRRATALLYGANTIGAVLGALLGTFFLFEVFGTRLALWIFCLLNVIVGLVARAVDRTLKDQPAGDAPAPAEATAVEAGRAQFVLIAAAVVGLVFLLLELVWYRMLAPLLGGTTYTFGLILAVALAGIGVGGLLYGIRKRPPTLSDFAATCALEAVCVAVPFALGDRIPLLALHLRGFAPQGFGALSLGWSVIAGICVLPAALVAGYQFPLLIALLGRGREGVARHVGMAYATNTFGAIVGSLAGGFALMPMFGAPGLWRLCTWALVLLGLAAVVLEVRGRRASLARASTPVLAGVLAVLLCHGTLGPTAVWRHSPIGAGRADYVRQLDTTNELTAWLHEQRRSIVWEAEGLESSVSLSAMGSLSFLVNGKSDGGALVDASTMIMSGLLPALLHDRIEHALVIGLGTGGTAGWLAQVPGVERVDVVEIEPAILDVARACTPVNRDVMSNERVKITLGDAREVLLTTPEKYDLIFSEPSNPYRAGIASLFTREFYEAVITRLRPGGIFVQWLQGYEIDAESVASVYATLGSVFPAVETWRTDVDDLVMVAGDVEGRRFDVSALRARVAQEPFKSGLLYAWRVDSLEGVLAHFIGRPELARAVAEQVGEAGRNSDDRSLLEYGAARSLGRQLRFSAEEMRVVAMERGWHHPPLSGKPGDVSWDLVEDVRLTMGMGATGGPLPLASSVAAMLGDERLWRHRALGAWARGDLAGALDAWNRQPKGPQTPIEVLLVAETTAADGNDGAALPLADTLAALGLPVEAAAIRARLAWAKRDLDGTHAALSDALTRFRSDPWAHLDVMDRTLQLAADLAARRPDLVEPLLALVTEPYATDAQRATRELVRAQIAMHHPDAARCRDAMAPLEPWVPWNEPFLVMRAQCYERAQSPLGARARADLGRFLDSQGSTVRAAMFGE
jgi:predicted membrane-bound spermidine synthase